MRNKKIKWLVIIFLIFISIGFAVLTANLNILTNLSFKNNTWDVHFENVKLENYDIGTPEVNLENDTSISFSGTFKKPGDYLEFTFNVVNAGTMDAQLESISTSLTAEQQKYIDYSLVYYTDNLEVLKNDIIYAGQARKIKARFNFKYDIENIPSFENLEVRLSLKYIQPKEFSTTVWNYDFAGMEQAFYAPKTGNYKIELWGASGGGSEYDESNNYGAYTSGTISLTKNQKLYVYVGAAGKIESNNSKKIENEFNGGGAGLGQTGYLDIRSFGTGGSATDIRLTGGDWDNFASLKSRIMVAGGGGGSYVTNENNGLSFNVGGAAGGLNGYDGTENNSIYGTGGTGATQTSSGYATCREDQDACIKKFSPGNYCYGGFGKGGSQNIWPSNGGGSGYYGGGGSMHTQSGGGGSSYISGHTGCVAIDENSNQDDINPLTVDGEKCTDNTTEIKCSYHYSGVKFSNTVMIDGEGYKWTNVKGDTVVNMPTHDGKDTMVGNVGNGYAKITYLN